MTEIPRSPERSSLLSSARRPLGVAAVVTLLATVLSYVAPLDYAATAVGAVFLLATVLLVLRYDAATIRHFGLSLGGLLEPAPLEPAKLVRAGAYAAAWAFGVIAIIAVPFALGFRMYWQLHQGFQWRLPPRAVDEVLGQMLVIALPEEAFFRGYLMTALDDAWKTPWSVAGAKLGWGWMVSCAFFAVGHLLTEPNVQRLAVFFPALVFGWLRARTGGIGAPLLFHALCNLLAATVARGYGLGG